MKKKCVNLVCDNNATLKCSKCKLTFYCSSLCQIVDSQKHNILCRDSLPKFCENLFQLYKENKISLYDLDNNLYLTCYSYDLKIDNKLMSVVMRNYNNYCFCGICKKDIEISAYEIKKFTKCSRENIKIEYYRCNECEKNNCFLCPNSFKEIKICQEDTNNIINKIKIMNVLYSKLNLFIPYDIKIFILNIWKQLQCC